ncbi:signal recognition particle-docking protein FtsY [Candidatus Bathyarchaeota archaeon]|nr:signal recognition particle-docking protein FtsY [Candidatus Bathyarchaeota archaeon]
MFERLRKCVEDLFTKVVKTELKGESFDSLLWEFKLTLIENDVAVSVADRICDHIKKSLEGRQVGKFEDKRELIEKTLRETLLSILVPENRVDIINIIEKNRAERKPAVLLFVGINGSGKTTSIAKVAKLLMNHGYSVVLACSDTYRAGAIEQLEEHAKRLGVKMIQRPYGADAASVAFDAINHAKAHGINAVLVDTAGRIETNKNLLLEMEKIARVCEPDCIIFVGDALAGNAAVTQAEEFNRHVRIDASILTKIDADAKGGAAISITFITKKPIIYLGTGQNYEDLIPFDPNVFVDKILGK